MPSFLASVSSEIGTFATRRSRREPRISLAPGPGAPAWGPGVVQPEITGGHQARPPFGCPARASPELTGQPHKQLFCRCICNTVVQRRAWKTRAPWLCRSLEKPLAGESQATFLARTWPRPGARRRLFRAPNSMDLEAFPPGDLRMASPPRCKARRTARGAG